MDYSFTTKIRDLRTFYEESLEAHGHQRRNFIGQKTTQLASGVSFGFLYFLLQATTILICATWEEFISEFKEENRKNNDQHKNNIFDGEYGIWLNVKMKEMYLIRSCLAHGGRVSKNLEKLHTDKIYKYKDKIGLKERDIEGYFMLCEKEFSDITK